LGAAAPKPPLAIPPPSKLGGILAVFHEGRIVSYRELLEAMSPGKPINIGNLRQYIVRLRNKVEIDPALPSVIITHHGHGYSFAGKEEAR